MIGTALPRAPRRFARAIAMAMTLVLAALAALAACALPAAAGPPKTDASNATPGNYGWFEAGLLWHGQFADPDVVRVGRTYFAYSSGAGGRYLGVLTSTDLVHWKIHKRWSTAKAPWLGGPDPRNTPSIPLAIRESNQSAGDMWNLNDALVRPAAWGLPMAYNSWEQRTYWAVGVINIGKYWYSYAGVQISARLGDGTVDPQGFGRYCLTVSSATSPLGPFHDITGNHPLYCDPDPGGSIDPAPYVDPATGQAWMTWKANGRRSRPGVTGYPSSLKTVRLNSTGHMTGPIYTLLKTNEGSWEGDTIENPSMIHWHKHWYLFYSANSFLADRAGHSPYATGYALCAGPAGPCRRLSTKPLMASTGHDSGPGGASAFVTVSGNLRLAYASYTPGEYRANTGIHQPRRMHIATVVWHPGNKLTVTGRP
jgi:beta-xylosidase